jgi:hypothetical protein
MGRRQASQSASYELEHEFGQHRARLSSPERRLMVAILRRAIWDFALYRDAEEGTERYQLAVDAAGWIFWDGEEMMSEDGLYTFKYICFALDLDVKQLRDATLKLSRESISRINRRIETEV